MYLHHNRCSELVGTLLPRGKPHIKRKGMVHIERKKNIDVPSIGGGEVRISYYYHVE